MGGKVPQSYYFNDVLDTTNKKELAIPKASKKILEFPLNNLGDLLKYLKFLQFACIFTLNFFKSKMEFPFRRRRYCVRCISKTREQIYNDIPSRPCQLSLVARKRRDLL